MRNLIFITCISLMCPVEIKFSIPKYLKYSFVAIILKPCIVLLNITQVNIK